MCHYTGQAQIYVKVATSNQTKKIKGKQWSAATGCKQCCGEISVVFVLQ